MSTLIQFCLRNGSLDVRKSLDDLHISLTLRSTKAVTPSCVPTADPCSHSDKALSACTCTWYRWRASSLSVNACPPAAYSLGTCGGECKPPELLAWTDKLDTLVFQLLLPSTHAPLAPPDLNSFTFEFGLHGSCSTWSAHLALHSPFLEDYNFLTYPVPVVELANKETIGTLSVYVSAMSTTLGPESFAPLQGCERKSACSLASGCDPYYEQVMSKLRGERILAGHRGCGMSFLNQTTLRTSFVTENTLSSFAYAHKFCNWVEFDVHVSRDEVPFIYHDYTTALKVADKKYLEVVVRDMKYQDLASSDYDHISVLNPKPTQAPKDLVPPDFEAFVKGRITEEGGERLFLRFDKLLDSPVLDTQLGFNIEVKYWTPEKVMPPALSSFRYIERDHYCDLILKDVFAYLDRCSSESRPARPLFLSSFDPDIVAILKAKQRRVPVLFLCTYEDAIDSRCWSTENAIAFAAAQALDGVVFETQKLFDVTQAVPIPGTPTAEQQARMRQLLEVAHKRYGLVAASWGSHNTVPAIRDLLFDAGMNMCIIDCVYNPAVLH